METKFSKFDKAKYKEIRRFILEYTQEETEYDSFSHYIRNDDYSESIYQLDKLLQRDKNVSLKEFFNTYREKIYNDDKFTSCCGFLDILLYRFDNTYYLGGNAVIHSSITEYRYGYQNYSIGRAYLLQHFDSLTDFYNSIIEELIKDCRAFKDAGYREIIDDVEGCNLLFTYADNVNNFEILDDYYHYIVDDIYILIIGGEKGYNLQSNFEDGKIEDYVDFEAIKNDIKLHGDAKKYNL